MALCRAYGSTNVFIWALDTQKTRINRSREYEWSWGQRFVIFTVLVLQQLVGGPWLIDDLVQLVKNQSF